ncbi:hypothetical protein [Leptolyngbya sp. NIES-2104]|uniref:hypothetical protein n=1 Tax=Leptolyngbya sp. NIES-2104 TaxID=1552121 RepID=UPI0006ECC70A|nr:hypothetical protein [Leptolyngbya sp. NIES-2104]GAP96183.1 hypothetical protein NIES2104_27180 [Leptolyngbya sp. NIES-2104]
MNIAQRTLAVLSATGTAALMALPVLAQAVPNQGVVNNGDINRIENQTQPTNTQSTDNCAFVSGGVGGPIDNSTSSSLVTPNRQFDGNNRSAAIAYRTNGPAGTSGHEAKMNLNAVQDRNNTTNSAAYNFRNSSNSNQAATPTRQFDGNNRSAAIAYRSNGPAGTSGHEAKMNLDTFQARQNDSYPTAYNLGTPQASGSLPVACAPR